jgi:ankyrin repeat protein
MTTPARSEWLLPFELTELITAKLSKWSSVLSVRRICRGTRDVCKSSRSCAEWIRATMPSAGTAIVAACRNAAMLRPDDLRRIFQANPRRAFIQASASNSRAVFDALEQMLDADPGQESLVMAASKGHEMAVLRLLTWPTHPVAADKASLFAACRGGHANVVNMLLNHVHPDTENGRALCIAASLGRLDVARVLLMRGAAANRNDSHAFIVAVSQNRPAIVALLLGWGTNPPLANCRNGLALFQACSLVKPIDGHRVAHMLLSWPQHAPLPDARNHMAFLRACRFADTSVVHAMLSAAPEHHPARANVHNSISLCFAAAEGRVHIVRMLLTVPTDAASVDSQGGKKAFRIACERGHVAVAELLLSSPAGALRADCDDGEALIAACGTGQLLVVEMLLARGHDAPFADCRSCEALVKASEGGHAAVVAKLLSWGQYERVSPFHVAKAVGVALREAIPRVLETVCRLGHESTLRELLLASPGSDYGNRIPNALLAACAHGHTAVVRLLLLQVPRACCSVFDEAVAAASSHGHASTAHALRECLASP